MGDTTSARAPPPPSDEAYIFVQPSALWLGVDSIRDFLPLPVGGSDRGLTPRYVNRATRFLLIVAIVLAIVLRSLWPIAIGAAVLLLGMLIAAGYQAVQNRRNNASFVAIEGDVVRSKEQEELNDAEVADEAEFERQLQDDTTISATAPDAQCQIANRDEFARLMQERFAETAMQAREQAAEAVSTIDELNRLEPYDPAATIPNPSRHNNWYEVDARYRPASPWTYAHKRVQAVGYDDDAPPEDVGPTVASATDALAPSESVGRAANLVGLNAEQADPEHMPNMYREDSGVKEAACVDDIYAHRRKPRSDGGSEKMTPMQDPTERMIESMYQDIDETFWQTMIAERAPPAFINPNDSQARRREEAAATERQSWRGFSMHMGP